MGRTIKKKSYFLSKPKGKSRKGLFARMRMHTFRGPARYSAKPTSATKQGRSELRRQQGYSRTMKKAFGINKKTLSRIERNTMMINNTMNGRHRGKTFVAATRQSARQRRLAPPNMRLPEGRRSAAASASAGVPIHSAQNVAHTVRNPVPINNNLNDEFMSGFEKLKL